MTGREEEEGDPVEQVALTVEIFRFHSAECEDIGKHFSVLSDCVILQLQVMGTHDYNPLINSATPSDSSRVFEKTYRQL